MRRILSLAICLVLAFTMLISCAQPAKPPTSKEMLELGEKYLRELDYKQAIVYFEMLIEAEPMNPRGYTGAAEAYIALDRPDKAISILTAGAQQLPGDREISDLLDKLVKVHFEMGERMLLDYDFERAVKVFLKLVRVVPLEERAYTGCAEGYIGAGDIARAISILRRGLERLPGNQAITEMLDSLLYEREREEVTVEARPILIELAMLCSVADYEAVFAKMQTEDFYAVTELADFLERPYIVDTEYGKIGVYEVNSSKYGNYMIYYGAYDDDIRSGDGVWLGYYDGNNYFADCEWVSDVPDGYATVREWNLNLAEDVVFRVLDGIVVDGVWDGEVNWNFEHADDVNENIVYFDHGYWVVTDTHTNNDEYKYLSGDISLDDDDLTEIRGIIGYGD